MRTHGIFIAYRPETKLKGEGLGRYLGMFAKAIALKGDVHLVIALPSWLRDELKALFNEMEVPSESYTLIGPISPPLVLTLRSLRTRLYWRRRRSVPSPRLLWKKQRQRVLSTVEFFASTRNPFMLLAGLLLGSIVGVLGAILMLPLFLLRSLKKAQSVIRVMCRRTWQSIASEATRSRLTQRMPLFIYSAILHREIEMMLDAIAARDDVDTWYVPTALWPAANRIQRPTLICVPDVVFSEFPVDFARHPGRGAIRVYEDISATIREGRHFVTYSEHTKQTTLVDHFGIPADHVSVVPHAPSSLDGITRICSFEDNDRATKSLGRSLLGSATTKESGSAQNYPYQGGAFEYIFYASQHRASKNILNLLRAYEFLLRRRYIGHKLILTAHGQTPAVKHFVEKHGLQADVLCLYGLTESELSAAYRMSALAVCPSLSEGGMPFTFTEALSVNTPVVMSDIAVTREVIVDLDLREATLFDPYDWQAMADKIEWALENREELYAKQRKFYDEVLSKRTWGDVVDEHIAIMDRLAERERAAPTPDVFRWGSA